MAGQWRWPRGGLARWALALGLIAVLPASRLIVPAAATELETAQRREAALLYSVHCAQCHGAFGQGAQVPGTTRRAPSIDQVPVALLDLVLQTGRMPPAGDPWDSRRRTHVLDQSERDLLIAYLRAEFDLPGEIPEPPEGNAAAGRLVFEVNCAACHGSVGGGGVAGGGAFTPRINAYDAVTLAEAIRTGPFEMPSFAAGQISDQQIGDVAAFLRQIEEEQGTLVLGLVELNPVFASAFAGLLTLVVVLSLLWIAGRPADFPDRETTEEE
ncbi:MAG TPA: c-type cytochrome [Egibacteraceae bacterium]|nr:c-type cytochrome [Egibacteraceae bacterium]